MTLHRTDGQPVPTAELRERFGFLKELYGELGLPPERTASLALQALAPQAPWLAQLDLGPVLRAAAIPSPSSGLSARDLAAELQGQGHDLRAVHQARQKLGRPGPTQANLPSLVNHLLGDLDLQQQRPDGSGRLRWTLTSDGEALADHSVVGAAHGRPREFLQISWSRNVLRPLAEECSRILDHAAALVPGSFQEG